MFRLFMILVLGIVACARGPGEECSNTDQCVEGGTCLKGVCSGYSCASDGDCGDQRCGRVAGNDVCVQDCEGDGDCSGEQSCTEVAESLGDTAATAQVCL